MEKYYIVTDSKLGQDYLEYSKNLEREREHVKEFMAKHGIEAKEYATLSDTFCIVPTEADVEKFKKQLLKDKGRGVRVFRKNSKVGKDWIEFVRENNIAIASKPLVGFYFKGTYGRQRTRLFDIDGVVYCSVDSEFEPVPAYEGMQEIKASEFFRIIEEAEGGRK